MKRALLLSLALLALTACTPEKRSPDAIREETARATSEATRDAKAVAQGVVQGLREGGTININKAPADKLQTLPGIDQDASIRIINNRPYNEGYDLVRKHVVTKSEYDKIAGKVTAK
ncbi:helix-hairpin-helix domain-containing protein [Acidobacteria bacterium AB60]|nr:helix-hairpin-helix domain-containing protein [Acidobacteria bacterium AB60]